MAKPMIILALDTSTEVGVVVLLKDQKVFGRIQKEPRMHNRHLLNMIQELLQEAKISLTEIDTFACGIGPGSFVGVRLGVAVIQGLSYACNKLVYPLSSLVLQAQAIYRLTQAEKISILHDARMQALYLGVYQAHAGKMHATQKELLLRLPLTTPLRFESDIQYAGSGLKLLPHETNLNNTPELSIEDLANITELALSQGKAIKPEALQPVYLHDESTWKKLV